MRSKSLPKALFVGTSDFRRLLFFAGTVLTALAQCGARETAPSGQVDFNFQIRPILADRCFKCHGPDDKTRKAKLRLDVAESAYAIRDAKTGTRAIVAHHPEQSE